MDSFAGCASAAPRRMIDEEGVSDEVLFGERHLLHPTASSLDGEPIGVRPLLPLTTVPEWRRRVNDSQQTAFEVRDIDCQGCYPSPQAKWRPRSRDTQWNHCRSSSRVNQLEQIGASRGDAPEWRRTSDASVPHQRGVPEWRRRPRLSRNSLSLLQGIVEKNSAVRGFPQPAPADLVVATNSQRFVRDCASQTDFLCDPCAVCLVASATHAFAPCGHRCVCAECAKKQGKPVRCPLCRKLADRGIYQILSTSCELECVPEWRRRVARSRHGKRPEIEALSRLQEVLFENTVKVVSSRCCATQEFGVQTEAASTRCVACNIAEQTHAALPCGHLCMCESCVDNMRTTERDSILSCLVCRRQAKFFVRVYM